MINGDSVKTPLIQYISNYLYRGNKDGNVILIMLTIVKLSKILIKYAFYQSEEISDIMYSSKEVHLNHKCIAFPIVTMISTHLHGSVSNEAAAIFCTIYRAQTSDSNIRPISLYTLHYSSLLHFYFID